MSDPVLAFKNAAIFQREQLILKDVSLSIDRGEFVYLIGKPEVEKAA